MLYQIGHLLENFIFIRPLRGSYTISQTEKSIRHHLFTICFPFIFRCNISGGRLESLRGSGALDTEADKKMRGKFEHPRAPVYAIR